jgi:hypothetical protein
MGLLRETKKRTFKGFPQPYSDETLSSWLFRCATSKQCALTIEVAECYVESSLRNGIDYDFSFGVIFKKFCSRFGIDHAHCKQYFDMKNKDMILSVRSRKSFCRQCLDEDVKFRSVPYWRKSWCRLDVAYCSLHKTMLATTREDYGLYRSWQSFAYFSDFYYERKSDRTPYEFVTLKSLGFRVQNWLHTNRKEVERTSGATKLIRNLLSSFLSMRTEYRYCGIARVAFSYKSQIPIIHKNYHYSLCMYHGARDSNATHRSAALIVLGVLLGFYSERELQSLHKTALYSCGIFPRTPSETGSAVLELLNEPEREWYISQFVNLAPIAGLDINSRMKEFVLCISKDRVGAV